MHHETTVVYGEADFHHPDTVNIRQFCIPPGALQARNWTHKVGYSIRITNASWLPSFRFLSSSHPSLLASMYEGNALVPSLSGTWNIPHLKHNCQQEFRMMTTDDMISLRTGGGVSAHRAINGINATAHR